MHPKGTQIVQLTQITNTIFQNSRNLGEIKWTPGEKQISAFKKVSSSAIFNIFGLYSLFTEKSDHEVMLSYIWQHLEPTT